MLNRITIILSKSLILLLILYSNVFAVGGTLKGTIRDAGTNDPLPYSNVILLGTSFGTAAEKEGDFIIRNIPPGTYTLRATYVGYKQQETIVEIIEGRTIEHDILLSPDVIEGETVTVTAQAEGQLAAINEQLSSISIKNVVSQAKIRELPDNNAAESVGRLPGVSLIRTGGEGSKVVIRGLSPQYNQVTIDGVEMSSNVASGNNLTSTDKNLQESTDGLGSSINVLGDRAADLSMISSSMLGGIEVIKAITPDMDATLIGGVVNFGMRKAGRLGSVGRNIQSNSVPLIEIGTQGGFNNLKNEYSNYKFVASVEQRFFDESFGVFILGSTEQRNLSANELGAEYVLIDKDRGDEGIPELNSLNLTDIFRERERQGITAVLDYKHSTGEIGFMNFASASKTNSTGRGQEIRSAPTNDIWYSGTYTNNELNVISNLLSIKQDIPFFHVDLKLSQSYSESKNPEDLYFNFWQDDGGLEGDLRKVHPSTLARLAVPNDTTNALDIIQTTETFSKDRSLSTAIDLTSEIPVGDFLTTKIKFGGSYLYRTRYYDFNQRSGSQLYSGGGPVASRISAILDADALNTRTFGSDYDYGDFLEGEYNLAYPAIDVNLMRGLLPAIRNIISLEGYRPNRLGSLINDYSGDETKSALYGMVTLNIGDQIAIIPGVRYQNLSTHYKALRAESAPGGFIGSDATVDQAHAYYLPMLHLRYRPLDWLQIHFAYTNTLNYPDYSTITPRLFIGESFIQYNNVKLKPARSENFDLVVSLFSNEVGLLSINGFKKQIENLIFYSKTYKTDLSEFPDLPQDRNVVYDFFTYVNNPIDIDVWGIEMDWQTHFWYLPAPFSGMVLNINYTHIFSEASYPRSVLNNFYDDDGILHQTVSDTFYTTRLLNQPNDILNLSIGYDNHGFSARISMLYQDNIFKRPDFWMQQRVNSDKSTRFDLSVKQTLPWYGIQVYFNLNNFTSEKDVDINQKNSFPASEQHYDMTADLGILVRL
jgi:TonB-dependent receptor